MKKNKGSSTWFFDPRWRRRKLEGKFMCEDETRTMATLDKKGTKWYATIFEWWWGWANDLPKEEIQLRKNGAKKVFIKSPKFKSRKDAVSWVEQILEMAGEFADNLQEFNQQTLDVESMQHHIKGEISC
jgi:hypothetical protein